MINIFYKNIKSLLIIYGLCIVAYLPFLLSFIWGNHDWVQMKVGSSLGAGLFEGRFSQFVLPTLLFEGNIFPLFTTLLSLLFLSLGVMLLFFIWGMKQQNLTYYIVILNCCLSPFLVSWSYFMLNILSNFAFFSLIILAFYLLQKGYNLIFSAIIFLFVLGGYPPFINLIGIIFFSLIILDIYDNNYSFKQLCNKYYKYTISVFMALICFLVIGAYLQKVGLQNSTQHNTVMIGFADIWSKIFISIKVMITQFFISKSFIGLFYKLSNLGLCIACFIFLFRTSKAKNKLLLTLGIIGLLFSSVISFFISKNTNYVIYAPRIDSFSLLFIYIFCSYVLIKYTKGLWQNISLLLLSIILLYSTVNLAYINKVWRLGFGVEENLIQRVVSRIEANDNFIAKTDYSLIQSGYFDSRSKFYLTTDMYTSGYMLASPYIPLFGVNNAYQFYYPNIFATRELDVYWQFIDKNRLTLGDDYFAYLYSDRIYPKNKSIYISNDTIIINLTKAGQNDAKRWFNDHYK